MRFEEYRYLYPPRPEQRVPPAMLSHYEERGWLAQCKMNGTCNVLAISPERKIVAMTRRHNEPHKVWTPNEDSERAFQNLPGIGWYVFVSELLHSKVPGIRNVNFVHDVVVADGEHLTGTTYMSRVNMLTDLFRTDSGVDHSLCLSHLVIDQNTWLAKCYSKQSTIESFNKLFLRAIKHKEIEGLVLKNPEAELRHCINESSNSSWMVKVRRPAKSYSF